MFPEEPRNLFKIRQTTIRTLRCSRNPHKSLWNPDGPSKPFYFSEQMTLRLINGSGSWFMRAVVKRWEEINSYVIPCVAQSSTSHPKRDRRFNSQRADEYGSAPWLLHCKELQMREEAEGAEEQRILREYWANVPCYISSNYGGKQVIKLPTEVTHGRFCLLDANWCRSKSLRRTVVEYFLYC